MLRESYENVQDSKFYIRESQSEGQVTKMRSQTERFHHAVHEP